MSGRLRLVQSSYSELRDSCGMEPSLHPTGYLTFASFYMSTKNATRILVLLDLTNKREWMLYGHEGGHMGRETRICVRLVIERIGLVDAFSR